MEAVQDQNAWGGYAGATPQPSAGQGQKQGSGGMDPWGSSGGGNMDPWGSAPTPATTTAGVQMGGMAGLGQPIKKDDPFANIWQ
jgi:hypothetical protein